MAHVTHSVSQFEVKEGIPCLRCIKKKVLFVSLVVTEELLHDNDIMVDFLFQSEEGLIPRICHVSFLVKVSI